MKCQGKLYGYAATLELHTAIIFVLNSNLELVQNISSSMIWSQSLLKDKTIQNFPLFQENINTSGMATVRLTCQSMKVDYGLCMPTQVPVASCVSLNLTP